MICLMAKYVWKIIEQKEIAFARKPQLNIFQITNTNNKVGYVECFVCIFHSLKLYQIVAAKLLRFLLMTVIF